jgi:hypothetical protein
MNKKRSKKIICFDLDGVLCSTIRGNYRYSKPIKKNIKIVNDLFFKGYYIKIFSARFMGRYNDNRNLAIPIAKKITISQLKNWNVRYHKLILGKPSYDIFVDDKALFFKKNWNSSLLKKVK